MAQGTSQHPSVPVSANALAKASVESFIASPLVCCLSNKPRKEFKFRIEPKSIGSFTVTRNRKRRDRVALRASGRRAGGDWKPTRSSSDARETGSYRRLCISHLRRWRRKCRALQYRSNLRQQGCSRRSAARARATRRRGAAEGRRRHSSKKFPAPLNIRSNN